MKKVQNYWPRELHTLKRSSSSLCKFPYYSIKLQRVLKPTALKLHVNIAVIFQVDANKNAVRKNREKTQSNKNSSLEAHSIYEIRFFLSPTAAVMRSLTRKKIGQPKHFGKPL